MASFGVPPSTNPAALPPRNGPPERNQNEIKATKPSYSSLSQQLRGALDTIANLKAVNTVLTTQLDKLSSAPSNEAEMLLQEELAFAKKENESLKLKLRSTQSKLAMATSDLTKYKKSAGGSDLGISRDQRAQITRLTDANAQLRTQLNKCLKQLDEMVIKDRLRAKTRSPMHLNNPALLNQTSKSPGGPHERFVGLPQQNTPPQPNPSAAAAVGSSLAASPSLPALS
eukprot:CAMPEP_0175145810 /NCGR_PEP_ID=MMETSP0087-20121206/15002_1 /TAXON_ID=136419 /ORGANISM="Unknown Unknown, Strain D1" /LENGTH=227 /DNA_ID=CAMNT_0016430647 /DNA_START=102 /DNA_END=785 /DNA_ORIENTATION=-